MLSCTGGETQTPRAAHRASYRLLEPVETIGDPPAG